MVAYLDRANVAFGKATMSADLGFSDAVFGFGAGIFFLGYFLLEIPGALIVERWSARRWIARILFTWGTCTILVGFVQTARQFYVARFLLGAAEAGFFPAIIVYLTHWFAKFDRARATAGFMIAAPLSLLFGAPLSAGILKLDWLGWPGWRWLFVLEGLPAIIFGFVTLRWLTDHPRDADWLDPEEMNRIEDRLKNENASKRIGGHFTAGAGLRQPKVWLLAASHFLLNVSGYGFILWLPTIVQRSSGLPVSLSNLWSAMPFGVAVVAAFALGRSSDRTGERKIHACIPMVWGAVFLLLSAVPGQPFVLVMLWLSLIGGGVYGWGPVFWQIPTLTLGESAAAASIGLINSVGNLGGFVGPSIMGYVLSKGYGYPTVAVILALSFLTSATLIALLRFPQSAQETCN